MNVVQKAGLVLFGGTIALAVGAVIVKIILEALGRLLVKWGLRKASEWNAPPKGDKKDEGER